MSERSQFDEVFSVDMDLPRDHDNPSPSSVRRRASERAFGSIIGSKSIKPVHLANVVFSHVTGETTDMGGFKEFVKDGEADHENNSAIDWISGSPTDEKMNMLQDTMKLVYDNDDGFYADSSNAPTCTSTRLLDRSTGFITIGRFLYQMLTHVDDAEGAVDVLETELNNTSDGLSLLARPALQAAETKSRATSFTQTTLDDPFEENKTAQAISSGFATLSDHFEGSQSGVNQAASDLRFAIKFGGFGLYVYLLNRHEELQTELAAADDAVESVDRGRFPIVLNYAATEERENNILQASYDAYRRGKKEVQRAASLGMQAQLGHICLDLGELSEHLSEDDVETLLEETDHDAVSDDDDEIPLTSVSTDSLKRLIEERLFPEIDPDSESDDFDLFLAEFEAQSAETLTDRIISAYEFAIERDSFAGSNVYPITGGVRNLIRRLGLLKPHGPWAKHRWFRPDPDLIVPVILSVISEGEGEEGLEMTRVCERLLDRYGLVVGGTDRDRDHLQNWEISFGSSPDERATFDYNYEQFKRELISLGYAREYSDGVTYVYSQPFL